jgi:hypothetical protein
LLSATIRWAPFVQVLATQGKHVRALLDKFLAQANVPLLGSVRAKPDLCKALPVGMCERLLAVPVRQESITKTVDVAAVDPFDSHLKQEFSFHLDAPVRILRAPLSEVVSALEGLHTGGTFAPAVHEILNGEQEPEETAAADLASSGDSALHPEQLTRPSHPPIPLVRLSERRPRTGSSTAPGVGETPGASAPLHHDERGEPVIDLKRTKPDQPQDVTRTRLEEAELAQVEKQLGRSKDAEEVVELLCEFLCPEGAALVFSVKSNQFIAKGSNLEVEALGDVVVDRTKATVFNSVLKTGHYLGSLPETEGHANVRRVLAGRLGPEVYTAAVLVSGRATLVLLVTDFDRSFSITRRVDRLAAMAGEALERIVLERKRSR